jgi:hypothetical protein
MDDLSLSYLSGIVGCMTAVRLREWRGVVMRVAGPSGVAISTRLHITPGDEHVLDLVAEHLGKLRRADLARVSRSLALDPSLDAAAKRQMRRDRLNTRKKALTAESSARWANAIIAGNDAQYRLARDGQRRHIVVTNWGHAHGVSSSLEFASPCSAIAFLAALSASDPGRLRDTQPSMLRCEPPDTASAPGGTSSRTTVPAPV